jgi:hypothetical protein
MNSLVFPKQELWAQYFTVGPEGYVDTDGELAIRPTASEAGRIARLPGQVKDIAWMNFSFYVGENTETEEVYPVGTDESFIATSRRGIYKLSFKPVSAVLEQGKLTKHTTRWLGYMAAGNHSEKPDRYDELIKLL